MVVQGERKWTSVIWERLAQGSSMVGSERAVFLAVDDQVLTITYVREEDRMKFLVSLFTRPLILFRGLLHQKLI